MLMARILLRQDQEIQALRREDTFLFFFSNNTQAGSLQCLVQAASKWHQESQVTPRPSSWMPLRQKLLQTLFQELLTRLTNLGKEDKNAPVVQEAIKNNVLLPDLSCPYLEWQPQQAQMQISRKTPLTLQKLCQNVTEMLEMLTDASVIKQFHSLPPTGKGLITPWRLQMSLRADRQYHLMQTFCNSGAWVLMATSMKQHNQHRSGLAAQLASMMDLNPPKPKGKGKGRSK